MMEASVPKTMRWLPKGMTVRYLKKATTDVRCEAKLASAETPNANGEISHGPARDVLVLAVLRDTHDVIVCEADITMWVSPVK